MANQKAVAMKRNMAVTKRLKTAAILLLIIFFITASIPLLHYVNSCQIESKLSAVAKYY